MKRPHILVPSTRSALGLSGLGINSRRGRGLSRLYGGGAAAAPAVLSYPDTVMALTPDSYWEMNETSGTTVVDSMGLANMTIGTGTKPTLGAIGPYPGSTSFNYVTTNVSKTQTAPLAAYGYSTAFSTTALVNIKSFLNGKYFVDVAPDGLSDNFFELSPVTSNGIRALAYNSAGPIVWSPTNLVADTWYHFAFTVDNSSILRLYIDGVEVGTATDTLVTTAVSRRVTVGNIGRNDFDRAPDAYISDVAVWGRVLTPTEVTDLFAAWDAVR